MALERYRTRFTITTAVRSSIAASYASSGIVSPSSDRSQTISAPRRSCASHTCPSVGKSSSDRITFRSPEKSRHEAIVASAIEMFVVIASSSVSHAVSSANVDFSDPIAREDVLHPDVIGRALRRPRVHVLGEVRLERVETGPSDALIR